MINEEITKANGDRFVITMIESGDSSSWDMELNKLDA